MALLLEPSRLLPLLLYLEYLDLEPQLPHAPSCKHFAQRMQSYVDASHAATQGILALLGRSDPDISMPERNSERDSFHTPGPLSISSLLISDPLEERQDHKFRRPDQQAFQLANLHNARPGETTVLSKSTNDLERIQMLSRTSNIVLFTPAIAPLQAQKPLYDPFEPLGRALARHHPRIHHIPYVHEMTSAHRSLLRLAHAAIVVVCDAAHSSQSVVLGAVGGVSSRGSNLVEQVAFAKTIYRTVVNGLENQSIEGSEVPVVLVLVTEDIKEELGGQMVKEDLRQAFGERTVLLSGNYEKDALERIAERIFDQETLHGQTEREDSPAMEMD